MTAEYQTEVKKSDEKWHASDTTKIVAGVALASAVDSLLTPDPGFRICLAKTTLVSGFVEALFLSGDAIVGSMRSKLKKADGKQKSS